MRSLRVLTSLLLCGMLVAGPVSASSILGTRVGADRAAGIIAAAAGLSANYAMAANDAGWDARFQANSTLDVLAITVTWTTVTAAGQVSIRVETDDGAGKPSGTLYDANATLTAQAPVAGTQTYTFAVAPTTGLTLGSLYHVLIITTTLGTTMTLGSYIGVASPGSQPGGVLTTATATTRNTFTLIANATPSIVLTRTGPVTESFEVMFMPFIGTTITTPNIFVNTVAAAKIVTVGTLSVTGYTIDNLVVTGTPAGDLRIRLFDASDAVVAGSTVTVDKDVIVTGRGMKIPLGPAISIAAGTYRVVLDSASSANSSNCFNLRSVTSMAAAAIPNATLSTAPDVTANPIVWTDTLTAMAPVALLINTITAPAAAGGVIGG